MENTETFTFIDLFAGIGGFHQALSSLGGKCLGFSEIDKDAIETYCTNYNISPDINLGDIQKIEALPEHDILVAGVPCQSWSIAGKNLGFEDDRGQLWNDTIYLLNQSRPKAFIFENVKGLVDPRNRKSLDYIMQRIGAAGYFAKYFVLNSYDFGVLQNRMRVYIVGFDNEESLNEFRLPATTFNEKKLFEVLNNLEKPTAKNNPTVAKDLFGNPMSFNSTRIQKGSGRNDFFIFSDIRNGHSTIHSWDIIETSEREKNICLLLLKNRRKKYYGLLDGSPLSLNHLQELDNSIDLTELEELVSKGILKKVPFLFEIIDNNNLSESEQLVLNHAQDGVVRLDVLKASKKLKINKLNIKNTILELIELEKLACIEERFEFKFTKISSGIFGVNRVYLPSANTYPTLVASDTNDFVATKNIDINNKNYKKEFVEQIYNKDAFRKITKKEACILQGFSPDFILPEKRNRWMKLIGNSVAIPVVRALSKSIIDIKILQNESIETLVL